MSDENASIDIGELTTTRRFLMRLTPWCWPALYLGLCLWQIESYDSHPVTTSCLFIFNLGVFYNYYYQAIKLEIIKSDLR